MIKNIFLFRPIAVIISLLFFISVTAYITAKAKKSTIAASMKGIVTAHNNYRQGEKLGSVKWNADIAKYAQEWSDKIKKDGCKMDKSPHRPKPWKYGENIAASQGYSWTTG